MPQPVIEHEHLPLLQTADAVLLDTLYADPRAARFLLTRLGGTVAVVAPGQMDALLGYLLKSGHTPKVLERNDYP